MDTNLEDRGCSGLMLKTRPSDRGEHRKPRSISVNFDLRNCLHSRQRQGLVRSLKIIEKSMHDTKFGDYLSNGNDDRVRVASFPSQDRC